MSFRPTGIVLCVAMNGDERGVAQRRGTRRPVRPAAKVGSNVVTGVRGTRHVGMTNHPIRLARQAKQASTGRT